MNQANCRKQLIELMRAHIVRIDQARAYLTEIKQAIAENRVEQLQQSLANPQFSLSEIEQLEQQRLELLSQHGFDRDHSGFEACLKWCDDSDGTVNALYQQLVASLVQLQQSIQLNHLLVNKGKERLRRSIGILTGLSHSNSCKIYGSNGEAQNTLGQRNIAIA